MCSCKDTHIKRSESSLQQQWKLIFFFLFFFFFFLIYYSSWALILSLRVIEARGRELFHSLNGDCQIATFHKHVVLFLMSSYLYQPASFKLDCIVSSWSDLPWGTNLQRLVWRKKQDTNETSPSSEHLIHVFAALACSRHVGLSSVSVSMRDTGGTHYFFHSNSRWCTL